MDSTLTRQWMTLPDAQDAALPSVFSSCSLLGWAETGRPPLLQIPGGKVDSSSQNRNFVVAVTRRIRWPDLTDMHYLRAYYHPWGARPSQLSTRGGSVVVTCSSFSLSPPSARFNRATWDSEFRWTIAWHLHSFHAGTAEGDAHSRHTFHTHPHAHTQRKIILPSFFPASEPLLLFSPQSCIQHFLQTLALLHSSPAAYSAAHHDTQGGLRNVRCIRCLYCHHWLHRGRCSTWRLLTKLCKVRQQPPTFSLLFSSNTEGIDSDSPSCQSSSDRANHGWKRMLAVISWLKQLVHPLLPNNAEKAVQAILLIPSRRSRELLQSSYLSPSLVAVRQCWRWYLPSFPPSPPSIFTYSVSPVALHVFFKPRK